LDFLERAQLRSQPRQLILVLEFALPESVCAGRLAGPDFRPNRRIVLLAVLGQEGFPLPDLVGELSRPSFRSLGRDRNGGRAHDSPSSIRAPGLTLFGSASCFAWYSATRAGISASGPGWITSSTA